MVISGSTISGNTQQFLGDLTPYSIAYGGARQRRTRATTITASTIDGNQGSTYRRRRFRHRAHRQFTRLAIVRSTISGNSASLGGGGVSVGGQFRTLLSSFVLHASTIAENTQRGRRRRHALSRLHARRRAELDRRRQHCAAANRRSRRGRNLAIYGADNLIDAADPDIALPADTLHGDPMLLPLADNGGPTRTHALATAAPRSTPATTISTTRIRPARRRLRARRGRTRRHRRVRSAGRPDAIFADGFDGP